MCNDLGDLDSVTDDAYAIAAHYGVSREEVTPVPRQGKVNLTVFLGPDLVLRVPRRRTVEDRLEKEAAVIPLVERAGVPTARLVSYDASRRIVDVPYIVLERLHGPTLDEFGYAPQSSVRSHTSLGEVLAALHEVQRKDTGPIPGAPEPSTFSPQQLVDQLTAAGEVGGRQFKHATVTVHVSDTTLAIDLPDGDTKIVRRTTDQPVRNIRSTRPRTATSNS